ncbi:RING-HC finger protein, partial [Candidatus Bathyarchaeota archaeon]|nr:RING-HC finger protein [Candidatus Bathyarchaeota archaeon]
MTSNPGKSLPQPTSHSPSAQPSPATSSIDNRRPPSQAPQFHNAKAPRKDDASRRQWREQREQRRLKSGHEAYLEATDFTMDQSLKGANSRGGGHGRRGQQDITHLLDYRSHAVPGMDNYRSHNRSYRRNPTWGPNSGYRAADKLRYVSANYRFVVSPESYHGHIAADADSQIDWDSVSQVIVSSQSQAMSCPICLSEPVAPRMAQCGHIFCLPCLLRYNSAESNEDDTGARKRKGKKCPICEDIVNLPDIRPARFYAGQESPLPRVGDDVIMRLMVRSSSSTLALPRESGAEALDAGDDIPWHFAVNVLDYGRVMKGTVGYMTEQYDEEIAALKKQEQEDELLFGSDGDWNQRAVKAIQRAKEEPNNP